MKKEDLQAIAQEAAKNIKTEADLNEFRQMLTKITVEAILMQSLMIIWVIPSTNNPTLTTAAMGFPVKPCKQKMVSLS